MKILFIVQKQSFIAAQHTKKIDTKKNLFEKISWTICTGSYWNQTHLFAIFYASSALHNSHTLGGAAWVVILNRALWLI